MFNFLRNWTKSAEEEAQEQVHSYVDNALTPREKSAFEQKMTQSPLLKAEVQKAQALKAQLRQMPQRAVPRNFTLDPAQYGRPARQPLVQMYPVLRGATALTAVFFVMTLFFNVYLRSGSLASPMASQTAFIPPTAVSGTGKEASADSPTAAEPMADASVTNNQAASEESAGGAAEEALPANSDAMAVAPPPVEGTLPPSVATGITSPTDSSTVTTTESYDLGQIPATATVADGMMAEMAPPTATTSALPREDATDDAGQRIAPTVTPFPTMPPSTFAEPSPAWDWQNATWWVGGLLILLGLLTYSARRQMW